MTSKRLSICLVLLLVLACCSVYADTQTLSPSLYGATYSGYTGIYQYDGTVGKWWSPNNSDYVFFAKFNIPVYAGVITQATINCDVIAQYEGQYNAGLVPVRVADDSWTDFTLTTTWPNAEEYVINRDPTDNGSTPYGLIASDVTSWLSLPGEGQGQTLSFMFVRYGGGNRGLLMNTPTMTITYNPVPEPGALVALGSGLIGLAGFAIRRRK